MIPVDQGSPLFRAMLNIAEILQIVSLPHLQKLSVLLTTRRKQIEGLRVRTPEYGCVESCSGAGDEATGRNVTGDGDADHVVSGSGDPGDQVPAVQCWNTRCRLGA
ncbi:MAG: hypothetical protein ABR556_06135 [Pyrinomonadaceae bacterium]